MEEKHITNKSFKGIIEYLDKSNFFPFLPVVIILIIERDCYN